MNIPTSFRPKGNLEKNIKQLIVGKPTPPQRKLQNLIRSCELFLQKQEKIERTRDTYGLGEELAKEVEYAKEDLETLSHEITLYYNDTILGVYLSALINKIITEQDRIILKPNIKLFGLGWHLSKGSVIIEMDVGGCAGYGMKGGKMRITGDTEYGTGVLLEAGEIIVEGSTGFSAGRSMKGGILRIKNNANDWTGDSMKGGLITVGLGAGDWTGDYMEGGTITVGRNIGKHTGNRMKGGVINVNGKIKSISNKYHQGYIYENHKQIRPIF